MSNVVLLQDAEVVAVILVVIAAVFLYLVYWTRRRRKLLGSEPLPSRAELQDRAYNQISLARSAAAHLEASGHDVSRTRQLIESAEAARRRGDPDTALGLAKSAQATLLQIKQRGGAPAHARSEGPAAAAALGVMPSNSPRAPSPTAEADAPVAATPRLPPNKAESRFQLTLLNEELAKAPSSAPAGVDVAEARRLAAASQAAFDKGEFTESLRLGLKGRRVLGGRVEGFPASRGTQVEAPTVPEPPLGPADEAASAEHCRHCGTPLRDSDKFCRGCGASKDAPRCPSCGEDLAPEDRFCGSCGAPIRD